MFECASVLLTCMHASMYTMNILRAGGQKTSDPLELEVWMVVMGLESSKRATSDLNRGHTRKPLSQTVLRILRLPCKLGCSEPLYFASYYQHQIMTTNCFFTLAISPIPQGHSSSTRASEALEVTKR